MNSKLLKRKTEKHEIQMLNCGGGGLKAWLRGSVVLQEVREIWRTTGAQGFEGQGGKFKPYTPFDREPMELFKKFI